MWRTKKPYIELCTMIQEAKKKMKHPNFKARADARKHYEKLLKEKRDYEMFQERGKIC